MEPVDKQKEKMSQIGQESFSNPPTEESNIQSQKPKLQSPKTAFGKYPNSKKIILGYWAIRGAAESIRFMLQYLKIQFEDHRYTLEDKDQWFKQDKPKLKKYNSAVVLPFLIDEDRVITQTQPILIYLCYKSGNQKMMGGTPQEKIRLATLREIYYDMRRHFTDICYGRYNKAKHFEVARDQLCDQVWLPHLKKMQMTLLNKHFFLGKQISYVDFMLADFLEILFVFAPHTRDKYLIMSYYAQRFWGLQQLTQYIKKSGKHFQRPYNGPSAVWR